MFAPGGSSARKPLAPPSRQARPAEPQPDARALAALAPRAPKAERGETIAAPLPRTGVSYLARPVHAWACVLYRGGVEVNAMRTQETKIPTEDAARFGVSRRREAQRSILSVDLLEPRLVEAVRSAAQAYRCTPSTYARAVLYLVTLGGQGHKIPLDEMLTH